MAKKQGGLSILLRGAPVLSPSKFTAPISGGMSTILIVMPGGGGVCDGGRPESGSAGGNCSRRRGQVNTAATAAREGVFIQGERSRAENPGSLWARPQYHGHCPHGGVLLQGFILLAILMKPDGLSPTEFKSYKTKWRFCWLVMQGKAVRTITNHLIDSVRPDNHAHLPQLASDFQMGPPGSVRSTIEPAALLFYDRTVSVTC